MIETDTRNTRFTTDPRSFIEEDRPILNLTAQLINQKNIGHFIVRYLPTPDEEAPKKFSLIVDGGNSGTFIILYEAARVYEMSSDYYGQYLRGEITEQQREHELVLYMERTLEDIKAGKLEKS